MHLCINGILKILFSCFVKRLFCEGLRQQVLIIFGFNFFLCVLEESLKADYGLFLLQDIFFLSLNEQFHI